MQAAARGSEGGIEGVEDTTEKVRKRQKDRERERNRISKGSPSRWRLRDGLGRVRVAGEAIY